MKDFEYYKAQSLISEVYIPYTDYINLPNNTLIMVTDREETFKGLDCISILTDYIDTRPVKDADSLDNMTKLEWYSKGTDHGKFFATSYQRQWIYRVLPKSTKAFLVKFNSLKELADFCAIESITKYSYPDNPPIYNVN